MKDFQRLLEECLQGLSSGTLTVEECLALYPAQAGKLELLLRTAALLNRGRDVLPSPTFTAYTHSAVFQYTRTHSRGARNMMGLYQRVALTFTMLVVALLGVGTAHAQSALPGDSFYTWKRTSEQAWRAISSDSVATDLLLLERRLDEWIAVGSDPSRSAVAKRGYLEALTRLKFMNDVATLTRILPVLQAQQQVLSEAGLAIVELDEYLVEAVTLLPDDALIQASPVGVDPDDPCLANPQIPCGQGDQGNGNPANGSVNANCNAAQGEVDPACDDTNNNNNNNGNGGGNGAGSGGGNGNNNGNGGGNGGGGGGNGNGGGNGGGKGAP